MTTDSELAKRKTDLKEISPEPVVMENFSYDDQIVRMFCAATIFWSLIATLAGLLVAVLLVMPSLSAAMPWLAFGKLRPLHTNAAIFAFAGNAIFAAVYYSTQRLCKARMWSDALSRLHFWGWQAIIVAAAVTLPMGANQHRRFAEFEWPIDIAIAVVWLLIFGGNFFMTLLHRRERYMYVSLWFYIATIVTVSLLHVFNNLVVPTSPFSSDSIFAGVQDAFMQWWYGHNILAFLLMMPFLGLMYYFVPKAAEKSVFSYKLSIVHFWSLVVLYIWAGPHQLHYTALPEWASTLGMLFGLMLWMPSWGGMINGLMTLRGTREKFSSEPTLKFFFVGLVIYGVCAFEASLLSIKSFNAVSHYSDWTIAHVHTGALGWNGFMTFGMLYWLLPRIFQTKIWSPKLINLHFWVGLFGVLLYIIPIYAAGMMQGVMLESMDDKGNLLHADFTETIESVVPMWWLRILGGVLYIAGLVMLGCNALMTWSTRPKTYEVPVLTAPRLARQYNDPEVEQVNELADVPVLEFGKKLNVWSRLQWHHQWERHPFKFTQLVKFAVIAVTLVATIPMFLVRANVPMIASVKPYTPLELAGREIYVSEGCYNCHSQQIRQMVSESKRYGEPSKAGEFRYDRPSLWGSRRVGPDLARGKRTSAWQWAHFADPSFETEGSMMPEYGHLLEADLKYGAIQPLVQSANYLGADYSEEELTDAEAHARKQAERVAADIVKGGGPAATFEKQGVALIAYLQRLGTDLSRPAEPAKKAETEVTPTADAPARLSIKNN